MFRRCNVPQMQVFMLALSQGDIGGTWLAISDRALTFSLPMVALIVGSNFIFGGDWQVLYLASLC